MEINREFTARVVMHGDEIAWQASPLESIRRG